MKKMLLWNQTNLLGKQGRIIYLYRKYKEYNAKMFKNPDEENIITNINTLTKD